MWAMSPVVTRTIPMSGLIQTALKSDDTCVRQSTVRMTFCDETHKTVTDHFEICFRRIFRVTDFLCHSRSRC